MTKTLRLALVRLAREKVVASTAEAFDELERLGFAEDIGMIPTPGSRYSRSLRAGYRITEAGAARASLYHEDGTAKMVEDA